MISLLPSQPPVRLRATASEPIRRRTLPIAMLIASLMMSAAVCHGQTSIAAPAAAAGKIVKLPGVLIDLEKGNIDLEAEVCLHEGALELVACTKGTKEHESIVAIEARPVHVHTALLLLGANSGHPAMQQPTNEEKTRWIHLPPKGDAIDVYLVYTNSDGKPEERPIGDFVTQSAEALDGLEADRQDGKQAEAGRDRKFSHTFVFAGSQLHDSEKGPRQYLADESGNVVSIVTFGDELLCLPEIQSHANGALLWHVDATHLPKVGSKVTLRLRPQKPEQDKQLQ